MATRLTKQFLQGRERGASSSAGSAPASSSHSRAKVSSLVALGASKGSAEKQQKAKPVSAKKPKKAAATKPAKTQERFLEVARRQQAQADRTRENLRKLKSKTTPKSQRLMAKALAQRKALFR